jgi:hypothetical protein
MPAIPMKLHKVIQELKNLNFRTNPYKDVVELLRSTGNIAFMETTYHKGRSFIRARPNYNEDRFEKKSDYSFKPQIFNTEYQRASTPNQTMFYGAVIPEKVEEGELSSMRITGLAESLPILRDNESCGYQKISFGRWYVHEDIKLLFIINREKYYDATRYMKNTTNEYLRFLKTVPMEIAENSLLYTDYLAEEFSKEQIMDHTDYLVSAIFSELTVQNGYDGIIYPSVRTTGQGFNVAITPEATKKWDFM